MNSGVHSSLHPNCHNQVIHPKFNLKIFYPPPYERVVWHYQDANNDLIQRSISQFNWERAFSNKGVNKQISIFNETILKIMTDFISHETKIFNDQEPPWINNKVKTMIQEKNKIYQFYLKNKSNMFATKLKTMQNLIYETLESCKSKYYENISKKLCSKATAPKYYWSLLKTILNGKKVPCIPTIFHDNKFITDFSKKADLFNSFFAKQCSIIENNSVLPLPTNPITDQYLANIEFTNDDIIRILRKLDPNKAHGHDMISIRMLKMSGDAIIEPLFKIFKNCLKCGIFPDDWKKENIVPIFKKGDKQNIKNYRPVSLLPICSKIFERIIYDNMLKYFLDNNLISLKQSGFRTGDSCINQLLSITYDIFTSFNNGLEVRGVFLDISKAFDKVWHDGLIFKLKQNEIKDKLLCILIDFLNNSQQRVVLNGQFSSWTKVNAGVPQGSILGPLLFLIYINYLPNGLQSNPKLFADDTSLFATVKDITTSTVNLNNDLTKISEWDVQWKMNFNPDPSKQSQELLFSRNISSKPYPSLYFKDNPVHQVQLQKHLGLFLDQKLSFDEHIQCVLIKAHKIIGMIRKLQPVIPRAALLTIYKSFLRPHLDYGDVIYDRSFNESFQNKLESVQCDSALAITGDIRGSSREKLYQELGLESLKLRRWYQKLCLFFKLKKNKHPSYLFEI